MSFTEPRLGCGAAVVAAGKILLIRRLKPPEAGHWGLPGGKVDLFETAAAAVIREVAEETGLAIEIERLLCLSDQIDRARGTHWFAPVYLATRFSGALRLMEPAKHDGLAWFPLDAPPAPLTQSAGEAIAALLRR